MIKRPCALAIVSFMMIPVVTLLVDFLRILLNDAGFKTQVFKTQVLKISEYVTLSAERKCHLPEQSF